MAGQMDEQNLLSTYNGTLFSLNGNYVLVRATTLVNLEDIVLSRISQTLKNKYCMFPLI